MLQRRRQCRIWLVALGFALSFAVLGDEKMWPVEKMWLPEAASTYAKQIDELFYWILYLTGAIFILTEFLLFYFLAKFRHREGHKAVYSHGSHKLEIFWTVTPAVLLAVIAVYQKSTWDYIKNTDHFTGNDVVKIQLYAEQYNWNFRYAGNDGKFGTIDDIIMPYQKLIVPAHKKVVIEQTSKDVIHSFFLPYMRLKQDVVPGMQIKVWFEATKTTEEMRVSRPPYQGPAGKEGLKPAPVIWNYEIVCAELCGSDHSQMRGFMEVKESVDYDKWVAEESKAFGDGDKEPQTELQADLWSYWKVDENGNRIYETAPVANGNEKHEH